MRFIIRAVIFGMLTGAALFFFPFHFFLLPVLFVLLLSRIFFRPRRWRQRYRGFASFDGRNDYFPAVPIDGFRRRPGGSADQQERRNISIH